MNRYLTACSSNAGFSTVNLWLPVPDRYRKCNVEVESKDSNSVLSYYKQLLSLRKTNSALKDGEYVAINEGGDDILSYLRRSGDRTVIVACNMTGKEQQVKIAV